MSDLSITRGSLDLAIAQPGVAAYFDPSVLARERERIFAFLPRYVGHEASVPNRGDFHALPQEREGRALVRTSNGVELLSNVCRHRQAIMLRGRGHTRTHVVCPLHRWTYDLEGHLVGAPHFPEDPCLDLNRYPLRAWNGLLFEDNGFDVAAELSAMDARAELNLEGYVFDRAHVHMCDYNWKTFIEVYLEDYHVGPFHPGLGNFVTCDDLRWQMGRNFSVQTVGVARSGGEALGRAGSPVYRRWQDAVLGFQQGKPPRHGAIWLTLYPTVMVEWYPNTLVVSTLFPQGPQKTLNLVEFFYPEEIAAFEREYVEAQQAAYMETCVEDDEIALRMDAGRRALYERGDDEAGPYQSPMEDGMQHFHEWYRRMMAAA
jgi:phenylpropionate dioxygenase-like ring-hydroxylating dioxygenase large terminal subunit